MKWRSEIWCEVGRGGQAGKMGEEKRRETF